MSNFYFPVGLAWIMFPVLGACLASFFNVLIYRMPLGLSLVKPASHCPVCQHPIAWYHNVPVLGWLVLRGRCAHCHAPISIRYPLVEALGGLLGFAAIRFTHPQSDANVEWASALTLFWLLTTLIPIFVIDFEHLLLPDTVTIGGIVLGLGLAFLPGGIGWLDALLGAIFAGGGLYLFGFVASKVLKRDAMGFGDVKLLASFGAFMGAGWAAMAMIIGSCLALLVMVPYRWYHRDHLEMAAEIPFGPFLGLAAPIVFLWGKPLLAWYMGLFGLGT